MLSLDMLIGGMQKTTLMDYPGKVAAIIFTLGCNFRCSFCHNPEIVLTEAFKKIMPEADVWDFFNRRKGVLDGVVITGGEPTLHTDLPDFIRRLKELGFAVKLDTNGTNPAMLKKLLDEKLIDYIAMDIKAPLPKYHLVTKIFQAPEKISACLELIKGSGLPHEFRSTVLPVLHLEKDIIAMIRMAKGGQKYFLQQFLAREHLVDDRFIGAKKFTVTRLEEILQPYAEWFEVSGVR